MSTTGIKNFKWKTNAAGVTITKYTGDETYVVIPEKIGRKPVKEIGPFAFVRCSKLTNVILPEGLIGIGSYAFEACKSLTGIVIPDSVTNIGSGAFHECSSLGFVKLPASLKRMDDGAFLGCKALDGFALSADNPTYTVFDGVLYSSDMRTLIACPNGKSASIAVPDGVISIGHRAFMLCGSLIEVILPSSLKQIGLGAFSHCSKLTRIDLPNSLTSLSPEAFCNCSALVNVVIPDSVLNIEFSAFLGCTSLKRIVIPDSVTNIGNGAFRGCGGLESLVIPNGVTCIEDGAFSSCSSLAEVVLPHTLDKIGACAFADCDALTDVCYQGSERQWKRICDETWNGAVKGVCVHFNIDHGEKAYQDSPQNRHRRTAVILQSDGGYNAKALDLHSDGSFPGAKVAASSYVEWGDTLPQLHSLVTVKVQYPFFCKTGDCFSAIFSRTADQRSPWITARLIEILSQEQSEALIRGEILAVGDQLSFVRRLSESELERMEEEGLYAYEPLKGNRAVPYVTEDGNWIRLYNEWGGGDFSYYHTIYTDEDGVDHLVSSEYVAFEHWHVFYGDQVLGFHRYFPFRWENGLLLHWESKTVGACAMDATDVIVPEGIEAIAYCVFMDRPNLRSLTLPSSLTRYFAAFSDCPNLKMIRITGKAGEVPELEKELRRCCPDARIQYQDDPENEDEVDNGSEVKTINLSGRLKQERSLQNELQDSYPQSEIQ